MDPPVSVSHIELTGLLAGLSSGDSEEESVSKQHSTGQNSVPRGYSSDVCVFLFAVSGSYGPRCAPRSCPHSFSHDPLHHQPAVFH